ncbi:helix-turn-helix domain-containing protein [Maritimibacter fusiformis]|nr:helix-turn-helix domain-containing protein [Maritimibacter fusiformis]
MTETVEAVIERLKKAFHVKTEADLARALMIGQSTISTWKARGRVPERIVRIAAGETTPTLGRAPVSWWGDENIALGLALVRFGRLVCKEISKEDFRASLAIASRPGDFWSLFLQAQKDLRAEAEKTADGKVSSALPIILHDDAADPERSMVRDRETIEAGRSRIEFSDGTKVEL